MLSIIFLIMLIIVLFRAGVQGRENPTLTNATFIVGIITILLTIFLAVYKGGLAGIEIDTIIAFVSLVFLFLLKPLVRKLLDLYDLNHQVKPDEQDRTYTKYEIYRTEKDADNFDNRNNLR